MRHSLWLSFILVGALTACNRQEPAAEETGPPAASRADTLPADTTTAGPRTVTLPNEKADSIRIEGDWQPLKLRLIRPAADVPFVTYVPEDMIAEMASSGEGEAHYFYANFGGRRNDDAFLLVFLLPAGTTRAEAVDRARQFKESRTRPGVVVNTTLGSTGDRFYYIAEHYPAEYGDGFGPRSRRIQDEWQWLAPEQSAVR